MSPQTLDHYGLNHVGTHLAACYKGCRRLNWRRWAYTRQQVKCDRTKCPGEGSGMWTVTVCRSQSVTWESMRWEQQRVHESMVDLLGLKWVGSSGPDMPAHLQSSSRTFHISKCTLYPCIHTPTYRAACLWLTPAHTTVHRTLLPGCYPLHGFNSSHRGYQALQVRQMHALLADAAEK